MALTDKLSINLPFPGFYDSLYSSCLDNEAEQWVEHEVERQDEEGVPKELRLDADEYADILSDITEYKLYEVAIAKSHVEAVDYVIKDTLGFALNLNFEEMTSPREYNFETDRLFALIPYARVLRLAALSRRDDHARLGAQIKLRCTSYDGFASHYSNDLQVWLDKPLASWDHNELSILLTAISPYDLDRDRDLIVYDRVDEDLCDAWRSSIDGKALDIKVQELRDEKLATIQAEDPGYVAPAPRDPNTPDLFS